MRTICLGLLVLVLAGCGAGGAGDPAPRHESQPAATGPTAREQTEGRRRARALRGTRLLTIPWVARVRWRYEADERFVTILEVPAGGATGSVWITAAGTRVRVGNVDPGRRAEAAPVREGPVEIKVVQVTEPATVVARVRVVYRRGRNSAASAPLVTARIQTRDHSVR